MLSRLVPPTHRTLMFGPDPWRHFQATKLQRNKRIYNPLTNSNLNITLVLLYLNIDQDLVAKQVHIWCNSFVVR